MLSNAVKSIKTFFFSLKFLWKLAPASIVIQQLTVLVRAILNIVSIYIYGLFVDATANYILSQPTFTIRSYLFEEQSGYYLIWVFLLWVAARILEAIGATRQSVISNQLSYESGSRTMERMEELNLQEAEHNKLRNLIANSNSFTRSRMLSMYNHLTNLSNATISLVSAFIVIYKINPYWTLFLMVAVIPECITLAIYSRQNKNLVDKNVEITRYTNYLYRQATDIRLFAELRVNNLIPHILKKRKKMVKKIRHDQIDMDTQQQTFTLISTVIDQAVPYIIAVFLMGYIIANRLTIGTFTYLFNYVSLVYNSTFDFITRFLYIREDLMHLSYFYDIMNYKGFGDISTGSMKIDNPTPVLRFKHLYFRYRKDKYTLKDINFKIQPGEKVVIIGSDGSGKTSILKLFSGLYKISKGDILLDDISVKELARHELKEKISVMFEDFGRYYLTIKENVMMSEPNRPFNRKLYEKALQITALDKWMKKHNYEDSQILGNLFKGGKEISSGHWQRLAIARTIYRDRGVMVLDEPFTYVDGESRQVILQKLLEHAGQSNKTVILIAQDTDFIEYFDRVLVIRNGRIIDKGKPKEIMKTSEYLKKVDEQDD